MNADAQTMPTPARAGRPAVQGLVKVIMELVHNGMVLFGLALASILLVLTLNAELRNSVEQKALGWLLQRQEARADSLPVPLEPQAAERATAAHPTDLPKQQANVAIWLARKYRVAPEPVSALVAEAFSLGERIKLDPTLILAVMAIESGFNPFSQSSYGAQGLMQVLTRVHKDKYDDFGGYLAAFDPVTNLRVGVQVLVDCIRRAGGSVEGGLSLYVGAVSTDGSDYVSKVISEQSRLREVAKGKMVPVLEQRTTITVPVMQKLEPAPHKPAGPEAESAHSSQPAASDHPSS